MPIIYSEFGLVTAHTSMGVGNSILIIYTLEFGLVTAHTSMGVGNSILNISLNSVSVHIATCIALSSLSTYFRILLSSRI